MQPTANPSRPRPLHAAPGYQTVIDAKRWSGGSTQSAPAIISPTPAGYHDVLLRTLSSSPKGSKMAEDAARAMLMAERARQSESVTPTPRDKGKGRAIQTPEPIPIPAGVRESAAATIGNVMLGSSPSLSIPFEFDDRESVIDELTDLYLNFPSVPSSPGSPRGVDPRELHRPTPGRPRHPDLSRQFGPSGPPPTIPLPLPPHSRADKASPPVNAFAGIPSEQNALAIFWKGDAPQMFGLITYNDPEQGPTAFPVEVMGKATQVVEVPTYWTGRVQKMTGTENEPATHCELTFDGFAGMTFFRVSYLHGNNGPAVMRTRRGAVSSGSPFRALDVVGNHLCTNDSSGKRVMHGHDTLFPRYRDDLKKFYREFFDGPHQGQVDPENNFALQATHEKQVLCEFY